MFNQTNVEQISKLLYNEYIVRNYSNFAYAIDSDSVFVYILPETEELYIDIDSENRLVNPKLHYLGAIDCVANDLDELLQLLPFTELSSLKPIEIISSYLQEKINSSIHLEDGELIFKSN